VNRALALRSRPAAGAVGQCSQGPGYHCATLEVESQGYKGHKPGSRIGQLHEMFDEKGEDAARKLGEKLELAPATMSIQFAKFRGGEKKASKPAGKRPRKAEASETHVEAVEVVEA
jgi:hypothetical protein